LQLIYRRMIKSMIVLSLLGTILHVSALGLSEIKLRSNLGQSFLAHIQLLGSDVDVLTANCVRARILSIDGVLLTNLSVNIKATGPQKYLSLSSSAAINEPAVRLQINLNCETQLQREFSILLDPPLSKEAAATREDFAHQEPAPVVNSMLARKDPIAANSSSELKKTSEKKSPENSKSSKVNALDFPQLPPQNKQKKQTKPSRDVLKLSGDMSLYAPIAGLRMSDVLSSPNGPNLIANMDELRAAQAHMASILRDESPYSGSKTSQANESAQIEKLKKQSLALQQRAIADNKALNEVTQNYEQLIKFGSIVIISVLIFGLLAVVFFYIRNQRRHQGQTWWESIAEKREQTPEPMCLTDIVNNVQASFDETAPLAMQTQDQVAHTPNPAQFDKTVVLDRNTSESSIQPSPKENRTPTLEETNSSIFNFFLPRASTVKVEEISDVTQEAEFWISMNDPQRAIEILQQQEEIESPESPLPWLFLLDLYRTVNNKERYDHLRERFKTIFNAKVPLFEDEINMDQERHIDSFTHLMDRIINFWFTGDVIPFLESLLVDDREGKREGFELPVYRDILMLLGVAHELERIASLEGQIPRRTIPKKINPTIFPNTGDNDPGVIEFESIDFPSLLKNKND
jgi:pilus assembly protein FimV